RIKLPQLAWHGQKELDLDLPPGWRVDVCRMAGHDRPALKPAEIGKAVARPPGLPPLREYARGKKEVVVIFDDMTRVTRAADIVPHVLAELAAAGIADGQVRFIAAVGCHGAMSRLDFVKKLGEDVLARFPVYNHDPFANCVEVGTTTAGTKVLINAEVMRCDLKIAVGSIVPHIMAGFGGGSKIILPGVAAYDTIVALHRPRKGKFSATVSGMGAIGDNPRRRDIDEAAALAGLDIKIDAIVNSRGETAAVYAGRPSEAFAAGLADARKHYLTPVARDKDIVIANTFAKANEAVSGLLIAFPALSRRGGDVVLIANAPEGQITHYLMGPFGQTIGGLYQLRLKPPENVRRLIIYTEYPELSSLGYLEDTDRIVTASKWRDVLRLLREGHGDGASVAIYPNADIQYCAG
ncbi:MAG TPA: lactate racemase domain-containing protein, partial [Dehalococcoidales bacterium]|nr:lactate racemase domain-containing protein [Dehalococcoidales bacterium]